MRASLISILVGGFVSLIPTSAFALVGAVPSNLDFGQRQTETPSAAVAINILNGGSVDVTVTSWDVTGLCWGDFTVDSPAPLFSIAPGGSAPLMVTFTPSALGPCAAVLHIYTDDAMTPAVHVFLQGEGVAVELQLFTGSLSFPEAVVGDVSAPQQVVIANTGTGTLTLSGAWIGGVGGEHFALTNPEQFPVAIPADGIAGLEIVYQPGAAGAHEAALFVTSDDADSAEIEIPLSGTAVADTLTVWPLDVALGAVVLGSASSVVVTIENAGEALRDVEEVALATSSLGGYALSIPGAGFPMQLAPGESTQFEVIFVPQAVGNHTATVRVLTSDPGVSEWYVGVTGEGVAVAVPVDSVFDVERVAPSVPSDESPDPPQTGCAIMAPALPRTAGGPVGGLLLLLGAMLARTRLTNRRSRHAWSRRVGEPNSRVEPADRSSESKPVEEITS